MRRLALLLALVCIPASFVFADDPISGPQVGKPAPGFEILIVTGDQAGKKVDQLTALKGKPVLVIFWSEVTRPGFGLLKNLEAYGRLRQPEGLEVLIVRLTDDTLSKPIARRRQIERHRVIEQPQRQAGLSRERRDDRTRYDQSSGRFFERNGASHRCRWIDIPLRNTGG